MSHTHTHEQVEEIPNFGQADMLNDDVMMLDVGTAVYLWIGAEANAAEKTKAMDVAQKYIATATDGRDKDVPIMQVCWPTLCCFPLVSVLKQHSLYR